MSDRRSLHKAIEVAYLTLMNSHRVNNGMKPVDLSKPVFVIDPNPLRHNDDEAKQDNLKALLVNIDDSMFGDDMIKNTLAGIRPKEYQDAWYLKNMPHPYAPQISAYVMFPDGSTIGETLCDTSPEREPDMLESARGFRDGIRPDMKTANDYWTQMEQPSSKPDSLATRR